VAFFVGIDGGGTKTRCLVGDEASLLGTGTSSGCKLLRVGEAFTEDTLAAAIHEACAAAGVSPQAIVRTCGGITGATHPEVARTLARLLGHIVSGQIEVVGDMEIAFEAAFGPGPGVMVIAGTGSIAYGRNSAGETARAGGWGSVVSDEGSGYWIGVAAIGAALRTHVRGEDSHLLGGLMAQLDASSIDELIARSNASPPPDFASLFPAVLAAAAKGDSAAAEVLYRAGGELAKIAEEVTRRLFLDKDHVQVAAHGGVFASSRQVIESFHRQLSSRRPGVQFLAPAIDPAVGALNRARRSFAEAARRSSSGR
jgi:glucosamine kinase